MKTLLETCKDAGLTGKQINQFYKRREREANKNNRYTLKQFLNS